MYRSDLLALVDSDRDWSSALPRVLGPLDSAGPVLASAAADLGLAIAPTAMVAAGTGDNMAAALGIGLAPGDVVLSLGTSGTVFTRSERPTADPTGTVGGFADATGLFLPLACTLNATKVTDAFARVLGMDRETFEAAALAQPAGAGGVVLVPYLDGERTPNRPHATGTLTGLRSDLRPGQIARAAFEGVVCGLLDAQAALARVVAGRIDGKLHLVGGGAKSAAYRRVVADLAARPVYVPRVEELVARGACVQAAAVLHQKSLEEVAEAWKVRDADVVPAGSAANAQAVRDAYSRARAS